VGNSLSLVVFMTTYLNQLSLSVYLAALAVSDSCFLLATSLGWLKYDGQYLFHTPGWCQFVIYITYVSSFLSVWFVAGFTVERYIAICHPFHRPDMCTVHRAKVVVLGLSLLGLVIYACSLWTSGVQIMKQYSVCAPLLVYYSVHMTLTYTDSVLTFLLPFILIFVLNVKIAYTIACFYKNSNFSNDTNEAQLNAKGTIRTVSQQPFETSCRGNRAEVNVTKFLLIISSIFLLIGLPSYIMRIHMFVITFTDPYYKNSQLEKIIQQLCQFLYYSNFAVNFLLYSCCGKNFRTAFHRMMWKVKYRLTNLVPHSLVNLRGTTSHNTMRELLPHQAT
jgi:hypothetical protein